ncbi:MAG: phosphoenolpyruvate--protein phosphotransferase [Desulfobulbaceae bacterium]|nr:phosphoenolpyruvate--protein phosphotransferase [Desulfobulbaceae bacterium]
MMAKKELHLLAPLSGPLIPLSDIPDPTFSQKMVGDGVSIDPIDETLVAPCDGVVTLLHKAHHALTIKTPEGVEVLIHIGLETVGLKGAGFTAKIQEGDAVRAGQALIAFDAAYLAEHAASLLTQMVITNGEQVVAYHAADGNAEAGKTVALTLELAESTASANTISRDDKAESDEIIVLNPQGLHARPTAVLAAAAKHFHSDIRLVKGEKSVNAKSVVAVMGLDVQRHDRISLTASGPDADAAIAEISHMIRTGLGESLHGGPQDAKPPAPKSDFHPTKAESRRSENPDVLLGVAASPGLVAGTVFHLRQEEMATAEQGRGAQEEASALLAALAGAKSDLGELQKKLRLNADTGKAAIFAAHQELLEDPELLEMAQTGIAQGQSAAFAWKKAFTNQAETLSRLNNELLAARAADINDVGRRVLTLLSGGASQTAEIPAGSILIAEDLGPSDTARLDRAKVLGFCTTGGSATSHASILARSIGIAAIAAIDERALALPNGASVVLNGDTGELRQNPSEQELARVRDLQAETERRRQEEQAVAATPAVTPDGHRIKVVANIGSLSEAEESVSLGGEGVGLLRSEFLFLQRAEAPSEDEQGEVYAAIAQALGGERDLVVRTLDVGGDKPLAYLPMAAEINPFLGVRGIRINLLDAHLLRVQVRAILRAAPFTHLHIMFPMVSSIEELREGRAVVLEEQKNLGVAENVAIGIMIEVPSAAMLAAGLAKEADFFSIGTNDLTQYTLAIDRGHPKLAPFASPLHPGVLHMIKRTVEGAHSQGKWVGVCGGLAGEIPAVPLLIGLGVDELSVSVSAIPSVKAAARRYALADCQTLARQALAVMTVAEVRALLADFSSTHNA